MAEIKISELPEAQVLGNGEIFPVVQSGITKKALISLIVDRVINALVDLGFATEDWVNERIIAAEVIKNLTQANGISLNDEMALAKVNGATLFKITIQQLANVIGSTGETGFGGIVPSESFNPGTPDNNIVYFSGPGTFTNFPDQNGDPITATENLNILSWNGSYWELLPVPITIDFSQYLQQIYGGVIIQDQFVNNTGILRDDNVAVGWQMLALPVIPGNQYNFSGIVGGAKYSAFYAADGETLIAGNGTIQPNNSYVAPASSAILYIDLKRDDETENAYQNFELNVEKIIQANDTDIQAKYLTNDNVIPIPINRFNAINKYYFETFGVTTSDLTIEKSNEGNLAYADQIIEDQYINNQGTIITGPPAVGWKMIAIPVEGGKTYAIGRINISVTSYYAFYSDDDTELSNGANASGETEITTAPANATILYVDLQRPGDPDSVYSQMTINEVTEDTPGLLTPYEPPFFIITEIKGNKLGGGGGQAYDQSLNTTDDVTFNQVTAGYLITNGWQADLPEGAGSPPSGIQIGDAWIDTDDATIKVRLI